VNDGGIYLVWWDQSSQRAVSICATMRQGPAVVDSPKNSRQKANARPSDEKDTVRRHKYLCALCRDEPKISVVLQGICLCAFVRYNGSKKYLSDHFISLPPRDEDLARLRWRARRTAEQQAAEPKNRLKMPSTSPSEFIWSRILIPPASDTDDAPTDVLSECVMKKRIDGTQYGTTNAPPRVVSIHHPFLWLCFLLA